MYIIISNFGNPSIALIQWIIEAQLSNCTVLSVDTGWAAEKWLQRVELVGAWIHSHGLNHQLLKSKIPFADWVRDRNEFPTPKYQWCAGMLKGLPINDWLDENDINKESIIVLPKRRFSSGLNQSLPEWIDESDHYGARKIWHPLYNCQQDEFESLTARSNIAPINHRSLECEPCIHNQISDFVRLDVADVNRLHQLEQSIGKPMFCADDYENANGIQEVKTHCESQSVTNLTHTREALNMGCGSPWGCGE